MHVYLFSEFAHLGIHEEKNANQTSEVRFVLNQLYLGANSGMSGELQCPKIEVSLK
jgi:hypothetical protein